MIPSSKPFVLAANCIPVKGIRRAIICDLQHGRYVAIPNDLYDVLIQYQGWPLEKIKAEFEAINHPVIEEYFSFLVSHEFVFFTDEPELFPPLELKWAFPGAISNSILDLDQASDYNVADVLNQLDELGCQYLEIRCFDAFQLSFYEKLLGLCRNRRIRSISLLLKYSSEIAPRYWLEWVKENGRITSCVIHSAPETKQISDLGYLPIQLLDERICSESHCGHINSHYFSVNVQSFTEALHFNSCLNHKLSVDKDGYIRNCPSMSQHFGHVSSTRLVDALKHPAFKKLWTITKDQIQVCKVCEFRYICTDCRAYLKDPKDRFSKPLKCGYDPYTCQWESTGYDPIEHEMVSS